MGELKPKGKKEAGKTSMSGRPDEEEPSQGTARGNSRNCAGNSSLERLKI